MANFDNYTNYADNAGVSSVIFGANSPVLEVELNEMQEIQAHYMREFIKSIVGNGITDISKLTYTDGKVKIADGCNIMCDGYLVKADRLELAITDGTAYLWVWEDEVDYNDTLPIEGNADNINNVNNWIKDNRADNETTRRKVIRYQLRDTAPIHDMYSCIPIAKIIGKQMIKLIGEVNPNKMDYTDDDIYGVEVDWVNNTSVRLAGSIGKDGGEDHNNIMAYNRRKCNVTADGTVTAYYGDSNYTESGKTADGTLVQVMVEQNKFYYKVVPLKLEKDSKFGYKIRKARYYLSDTPKDGFKVYPAFIRNGIEVDKIYIASYKSSILHVDGSISPETRADTDTFISCAGYQPYVGTSMIDVKGTISKMQTYMSNIQLKDFTMMNMDIYLFLIEYATLNIQNIIGPGYTNIDNGTVNTSAITGSTAYIGNGTGYIDRTGKTSITYRGEEDIFGSAWEHIDGFNIKYTDDFMYEGYWADHDFSVNKFDGSYKSCGFTLPYAYINQDYISAFGYNEGCDFAFIPTETVGSQDDVTGDCLYIDVGKMHNGYGHMMYGGGWDNGADCGLCATYIGHPGLNYYSTSSRLAYIPMD